MQSITKSLSNLLLGIVATAIAAYLAKTPSAQSIVVGLGGVSTLLHTLAAHQHNARLDATLNALDDTLAKVLPPAVPAVEIPAVSPLAPIS